MRADVSKHCDELHGLTVWLSKATTPVSCSIAQRIHARSLNDPAPAVIQNDNFRMRFEMRKELGRGAAGEVHLASILSATRSSAASSPDPPIWITRKKAFAIAKCG